METSYNKPELMNGSTMKLPKNIRQIGYFGNSNRIIYVEDYVMTFMKQLAQKEHTGLRVAVLLGYYVRTDQEKNIFIKGAVEMKTADSNIGPVFSDDGWTSVYENIKKYFSDIEIVGWSLIGPGFLIESGEGIRKMHIDNFSGPDKTLLKIDNMEKEEAFYLYENNQLVKQNGYYIYYEKNEEMQNYMVENKDVIREEAEYNDQTTRKIRTIIQEKKEPKEEKNMVRLMYAASTLFAIIVLVIAAAMLKNYEQMHNMETAINTLTENLGKGEKSNATENTDSIPVAKSNSQKITEAGNTETQADANKETMEIETVAGNVSPTEKAATSKNQSATGDTTAKQETSGAASDDKKANTTEQTVSTPKEADSKKTGTVETEAAKTAVKEKVVEKKYYIVRAGDSLAGISYKLYNSANYIDKIKALNGIEDENKIYAGQKLLVP